MFVSVSEHAAVHANVNERELFHAYLNEQHLTLPEKSANNKVIFVSKDNSQRL
jgi:hypothetical protein